MKFSSGKRIGQSEQQLTTAVFFSFFLHAILFLAAIFLHFAVMPRISVPPFYAVKLVGLPSEPAVPVQTQPTQAPAAPEKHQAKPAPAKPRSKKGAEKTRTTAHKNAVPDLSATKKKQAAVEQEKPSEPQTAASRPSGDQPAEAMTQGVAVATGQQMLDAKYQVYMRILSGKIQPNWRPLTGAKNMKARIVFTINRRGSLVSVKLDEEQSTVNPDFKLAALRAIQVSNPFPPLPDDYPKQTMELSVDLTPRE